MRGILTIARLTWLEARRRRILLAAILGGLAFVLAFATALYFAYSAREGIANAGVVQARVILLTMFVAALYVVNFLTIAVAIMLPVDTLAGSCYSSAGSCSACACSRVSRRRRPCRSRSCS
jgi:Cu-processing system permease protein